jgi:hypothetical protein
LIELRQAVGVALCLSASTVTPAPALAAPEEETSAQTAAPSTGSSLRSSEDGWLDFSGFLDKAYGFIPVLVPITEPAVGCGVAGGTGFRYELARKYGIHAGLDVAFGSDHPILYLQIGSAWARP